MENRYFSREMLAILLGSSQWRLLSSFFPPDVRQVREERFLAWVRQATQRHANQELIIALKGGAFFGFQGRVYRFNPGDAIFIDANEPHGYPYPPFYPDVEHLLVMITRNVVLFRTYAFRAGREAPQKIAVPLEDGNVSAGLLEECLIRIRKSPDVPWQVHRHRLLAILRLMVGEIVAQGYVPEPDVTLSKRSTQERMVAMVQEHIRDTAGRGISLDGLSTLTGYSKHHLLRIFRSVTGQTIHAYIDSIRMIRVREMMGQGSRKKEISTELGFSSPAAFSRWLRGRLSLFTESELSIHG